MISMLLLAALAAPNGELPVQGYLTDASDQPIEGQLSVVFTLYDAPTGGEAVWSDDMAVAFDRGAFTTLLGSEAPLDLQLMADHAQLFLGVRIGGDDEMERMPVGHVPFAAWAERAGEANTLGGYVADDFFGAIPDQATIEGYASDVVDGTTIAWSQITDAPEGTEYLAGEGLLLSTDTFSVDETAVGDWARMVCFDTTAELRAELDGVYLTAGYAPAWSMLTGVPGDLADGDDVRSRSEVEDWARGVCFDSVAELRAELDAVYLSAGYAPDWSQLTGVPADLADGDDVRSQSEVEAWARGVAYDTEEELTALLDDNYLPADHEPPAQPGGFLIPNSTFENGLTGWSVTSGTGAHRVVSDGAAGTGVFENSPGSQVWIDSDARVPVNQGYAYEVRGSFRRRDSGGLAGGIFLGVSLYDGAGANLPGDGTWWYYPVESQELTGTEWHSFAFRFGADTERPFDTSTLNGVQGPEARFMSVGAILNYAGGATSGDRIYQVTDLQLLQVPRHQARYIDPPLLNGWQVYSAGFNPPGYYKDDSGFVHLRGMLRDGTSRDAMFTLPEGYRPAYRQLFGCRTSDNAIPSRCDVDADGNVLHWTGATGWVSLDGLSFLAER